MLKQRHLSWILTQESKKVDQYINLCSPLDFDIAKFDEQDAN